MRQLVEMVFGSHLYGTATEKSDRDWKAVHLPPRADILLQRAKPVLHSQTKADPLAKNAATDTDRESYALHKYLALAAENQTVALDMLFAPPSAWTIEPSPIWLEIIDNRTRIVSRRCHSFLGYCRQQANKYGIKGSRMAAARQAAAIFAEALEKHPTHTKAGTLAERLEAMAATTEHCEIIDTEMPGNVIVRHISVCGRKVPYTSNIKFCHDVYANLFAEYGKRALAAEQNENIDWKALSHAVRVGRQAVELLTTGHVTQPRPEADHLLAIKTGRLDYKPVSDEIETLLVEVERAAEVSILPPEPDLAWIDSVVVKAYGAACVAPANF